MLVGQEKQPNQHIIRIVRDRSCPSKDQRNRRDFRNFPEWCERASCRKKMHFLWYARAHPTRKNRGASASRRVSAPNKMKHTKMKNKTWAHLCVRAGKPTACSLHRINDKTKTKKFFGRLLNATTRARCSAQINECKRTQDKTTNGYGGQWKTICSTLFAVGEERRLYMQINALRAALPTSVYITCP